MTNEKLNALKQELKTIDDELMKEANYYDELMFEKEESESELGCCDGDDCDYANYEDIISQMDEQEDKIQKLKNEYIVVLVDIAELIEGRKSTHES